MIPNNISPYFKTIFQKADAYNTIIKGTLICCSAHNFEVQIFGEVQRRIFSKMCLLTKNDTALLDVRCKKCGKVISVFDSRCDGYEECGNRIHSHVITHSLSCEKCLENNFSVYIKYEYPDIHELTALKGQEADRAFTWVWITLECNHCKKKYKNFIDLETG